MRNTPPALTPAEESIVRLVVDGRSNPEVAEELHREEETCSQGTP
jgi:DNA-binding NarL/FixJ family response regulator